jgi:hypothetical protein
MAKEENPLLTFVDKMMFAAGFDNLPEETRKLYREKLAQQSLNRINLMAMRLIPSDKLDELEKLVEGQPDRYDLHIDFFMKYIPEFQQRMIEELTEFAKTFIATAKKLGE